MSIIAYHFPSVYDPACARPAFGRRLFFMGKQFARLVLAAFALTAALAGAPEPRRVLAGESMPDTPPAVEGREDPMLTPTAPWQGAGAPLSVPVTRAGHDMVWENLGQGLDLAALAAPRDEQAAVLVTVLRVDPAYYDFSLHSVLWDGPLARTIEQWAETLDLTAVINAGMYLPDGRTNTGYMRRGELHNNSRIAARYGGFFVCGPRQAGLPGAAVLDRTVDEWETLLPQYEVVVQNFRLLGARGAQIWPENGPVHAVAAIGADAEGRILFLHCRESVTVHRFVEILLAHPDLHLTAAVYVEGGSQAALTLRLPGRSATWAGRSAAQFLLGGEGGQTPLPNVIGARPRARP